MEAWLSPYAPAALYPQVSLLNKQVHKLIRYFTCHPTNILVQIIHYPHFLNTLPLTLTSLSIPQLAQPGEKYPDSNLITCRKTRQSFYETKPAAAAVFMSSLHKIKLDRMHHSKCVADPGELPKMQRLAGPSTPYKNVNVLPQRLFSCIAR
jgi:hypothetical protein